MTDRGSTAPTLAMEASARRARRVVLLAAALLVMIAVLGVVLVLRFVAAERARDLVGWQVRLGIVADSRAAAIDEWIEQGFTVARELAENPTVQLYLTELQLAGGDPARVTDGDAQIGYLRNLATATAEREGFVGRAAASQVPANLPRIATAGIGILDPNRRAVAASPSLLPLDAAAEAALAARRPGDGTLIDLYLDAEGQPAIGFAWPVRPVQAAANAREEFGLVIAVRPAAPGLARRLQQPGATEKTAETLLVRRKGETVEYLSTLADGTPATRRALALDTPNLAAAFALAHPGGFTEGTDYAGKPVLAVSRPLKSAPWTLVRKVDASEALAETERRRRTLLAVLLGAIAFAAIVVVAVWRHGTSTRAAAAATRFHDMADRFERLFGFMRTVTDAQPTAIAAVAPDGRYTFANAQAAAGTGITPDEMLGKTLAQVIGPVRARTLEERNREARDLQVRLMETETVEEAGQQRILKTEHLPLPDSGEYVRGVLMVTEDITDLMNERARRERTLRQLVATLVALVDRRDPYSANHSARVAEVARAIAAEMGLQPVEVETVEIAASVMNLGKIAVPADLLTRHGTLSEDEMRQVRESILASADLLTGIEFDGPVVDTLRQMQEHWDGSGTPQGLKGDAILPMARIVSVANAFVGMASARAWRPGLTPDQAADALLKDAGRRFDRATVAALLNVLENRGGREKWARFGEPPRSGNGAA
ncbi:HD domain-containing phosphohydrolase [Desertibaculum subflavum]|uniref:HD domain-containing phosphohydrolase n=1 Tax=Desertibaculum subflavum TaxID=2268458 RepID=UPI000E65EE28